MDEQKIDQNKRINLTVGIFLLIILFILCGIFITSTTTTREDKILSYLKKKYDTEFQIIGLKDSGENILVREQGCDGSTCIPEIKEPGAYYYIYEVLSVSDNITFELEYMDRKLRDTISESYFRKKYGDDLLEDIANYIVSMIGDEKTTVKCNIYEYKTYGMDGFIEISIDQNLDNILDKQYIEKKLRKISSYIKNKTKNHNDLAITAEVNFQHSRQLWFYYKNVLPIVRIMSGSDTAAKQEGVYTYLEGLNK